MPSLHLCHVVAFVLFQFTMEGTPESRGMNYRALDCLFQLRDERAVDTRFDVSITLLEIYNEEIRYERFLLRADVLSVLVKRTHLGARTGMQDCPAGFVA